MNTARGVWMGWGTLMLAGGAAYYFAKRDINAHRREHERPLAELARLVDGANYTGVGLTVGPCGGAIDTIDGMRNRSLNCCHATSNVLLLLLVVVPLVLVISC